MTQPKRPGPDPVGEFQRWLVRSGARGVSRELGDQVRSMLGRNGKQDVWETATSEPPGESPECAWCPVCRAARVLRDSRPGIASGVAAAGGTLASVVQDAMSAVEAALAAAGKQAADARQAGTPASSPAAGSPAPDSPAPDSTGQGGTGRDRAAPDGAAPDHAASGGTGQKKKARKGAEREGPTPAGEAGPGAGAEAADSVWETAIQEAPPGAGTRAAGPPPAPAGPVAAEGVPVNGHRKPTPSGEAAREPDDRG